MKGVIDTSFLINLIFIDQPFHEEAKEKWRNLEKVYIPSTVLFEFSYFIFKKNLDKDFIRLILSDRKTELIDISYDDILFSLSKNPKSYDEFNDFIILHTAIRLRSRLLTFDKDLEKEYEKHL